MRPYFSIIIPYYNSIDTIGNLIESILKSKKAPQYEIIVVDDGSKIKFQIPIFKIQKNPKNIIRVFRLPHNKGPAAARNMGAKESRGKFLVFLDSDVVLFKDTLHNLAKVYEEDPDVVAQTGVWTKEQKSNAFFPNYKALRDWSYWINERDKSGYYFLFSTRIASIKKAVFMRLGGFDEKYPGALVEDIELTYRIARRYAIIFSPQVRVKHEFESFWPIAKKYFLRAYYWTKLYGQRKKFDPVATTWWEALASVSGAGIAVLGIFNLIGTVFILSGIWISNIRPIFLELLYSLIFVPYSLFLILLFIHILLIKKFLIFMYKEKGLVFAIKGFLTGIILYCFIFSGALWGKIR